MVFSHHYIDISGEKSYVWGDRIIMFGVVVQWIGGGLWDYVVSPSPLTLDFGFWIWDLDLGLDLGLTIIFENKKIYFISLSIINYNPSC